MKTRLWTLGHIGTDHTNTILPTKATVDKLKSLINEAKAKGGDIDIVWGPELGLTCTDGVNDNLLIPVPQENGEVLYRLQEIN